jgi:cyclophilin family peptidyl-prolyl cis-trans isomerase
VGLPALVHLRGEDALERLRRAAAAPSEAHRSRAFAGLVARWRQERDDARSHGRYLEVFLEALESTDARRRSLAATLLADSVLAHLGGVAALERAAASEDPDLRQVAARALQRARGDGAGPSSSGTSDADPQGRELDERARLDWEFLAGLGPAPRLILDTDRGRVVLRLDPEAAPQTVQTISRFAESGSYDGVAFHRVVPNFVIQGGDFTRGDGSGGPGFTIRTELNLLRYERGVIGMASAGKDTEGSQFFITHSMQPHLDGGYTSFGWVEIGMDVVDRIRLGDHITRAHVERGD